MWGFLPASCIFIWEKKIWKSFDSLDMSNNTIMQTTKFVIVFLFFHDIGCIVVGKDQTASDKPQLPYLA